MKWCMIVAAIAVITVSECAGTSEKAPEIIYPNRRESLDKYNKIRKPNTAYSISRKTKEEFHSNVNKNTEPSKNPKRRPLSREALIRRQKLIKSLKQNSQLHQPLRQKLLHTRKPNSYKTSFPINPPLKSLEEKSSKTRYVPIPSSNTLETSTTIKSTNTVVSQPSTPSPRKCAGNLARERLKAAEKIRDKRYFYLCCAPACSTVKRPKPPSSVSRYQPYHNTWLGLKYGCNCSSLGAVGNVCDIRSGQCRCKAHATGRACDICEDGYWGLPQTECQRCQCGAGASTCDPESGACLCSPGVSGDLCDKCLTGFYGYSSSGCLPCSVCTDGKVCSPESGRCVCAGGARGPRCRACSPGHFRRGGQCQACQCGLGAVTAQCNVSGECTCRPGWMGLRCDQCALGHYGPRCQRCGCDQAGAKDCGEGTCPCDNDGRCRCKENVVGDKCDSCLPGTFGLAALNPSGCTACFCFGRSSACSGASLTRAALHSARPSHVTLTSSDAFTQMDTNSLLAIHTDSTDAIIALPKPEVPVYIELPSLFSGDKITSYGGALRFKLEEEGGAALTQDTMLQFPLVRLYGKNIVLDYFERIPPVNGTHSVRFHESLWVVRDARIRKPFASSEVTASRSALMLALMEVERLVIRVTTKAPTSDDPVHALLLNISLDTAMPGLSRSEPALGVEVCDCPPRYKANSCQEPALGFWMPPPKIHMTTVSGTIVISVEGEAQPCKCNGRASECDPRSGHCLNCTDGTGGPRCEICAEGYHGAPNDPYGCQACPCPSRARNYAKACAVTEGRLHCLCKPGYAGLECESCASGYYRSRDGACVSCKCSSGASSASCDAQGYCHCLPDFDGPKCDQCIQRRTFLDHGVCTSCDNCTQTLLNSIEDLTVDLRYQIDTNELSKIPAPYPTLLDFAHNSSNQMNALQDITNVKSAVRHIDDTVRNMENKQHDIFTITNKFKTESKLLQEKAETLSTESAKMLEDAIKNRRHMGVKIETLNEFARSDKHLNAHKAIKEARHSIKAIRNIDLGSHRQQVNDIYETASAQYLAIQEMKQRNDKSFDRLKQFNHDLRILNDKILDLQMLSGKAWEAEDALSSAETQRRLADVKDIAFRCRLLLEDIETLTPKNITNIVEQQLSYSYDLLEYLPNIESELKSLIIGAEEKEGILYSLTPVYREKYLDAVEKHVKELGEKSENYKNLFSGTKANAATGVKAARAWSDVADTVREAAELARNASDTIAEVVKLSSGPDTLIQKAEDAMRVSDDLKIRGTDVLTKSEEMVGRLDQVRRGADVVSVTLRGLGWQARELANVGSTGIAMGEGGVRHKLNTAGAQADRIFATTRALYDEASEIRRTVRYNLRRQLAELQKHGDIALGAAQEHVSSIRGSTVRGAEMAQALEGAAQARALQRSRSEEASQRPSLVATLARARHAAAAISVSLTSPSSAPIGCSRAYSLPSQAEGGDAVTRITLGISFDGQTKDGPLIFLKSDEESSYYMKLWVEAKRLHLSWDVGGGIGQIVHPLELEAAHDDADHTAYKIDLERVWNTVRLTVERAGRESTTSTNSTASSFVSLKTSLIWLGSIQPDSTGLGESGAPRPGLPGCVHALHWDGSQVGLWNFVKQPKDGKCAGCTQRWYSGSSSGADRSLVWFGGHGYVELKRSGLRPSDHRHFSVSFTFKSRDEDALLFLALDKDNNRSVSVKLHECRVVFEVQYSGSNLRIAAGGKQCHGRVVHVQAIRLFQNKLERGSLRVNGEETLGSPTPPIQSAAALPQLSGVYWVGGSPPSDSQQRPSEGPGPLMGCLGALTVDRNGYNLLDTPNRDGVEPNCGIRTLRSATLDGRGHIELPSPPIRRKSTIGVSFRTTNRTALILWRAPTTVADNELEDDDQNYLALSLIEGNLELSASVGKGSLVLRSNGSRYDDGVMHNVRIIRTHKQLELWVESQLLAAGALGGAGYASRSGGLFIGGAKGDTPRPGLSGTVTDLIIDHSVIGFENAISWQHAKLGRAPSMPESRFVAQSAPRALQAHEAATTRCTKTTSYTVEAGAVKFGDSPHSHAPIRASSAPALHVALQFRTYAAQALLMLATGTKNKPKHYVALLVRDGKLKLIVRGRKRKEITLPGAVNNNSWRSVTLTVSNSKASLSSGGLTQRTRSGSAARSRLYLAGLPPLPTLPNVPPALRRVPGLLGCMRRLSVNGVAAALARAAVGATHCLPRAEPAAYFSGDAFAVWASQWASGEGDAELRLKFRTAEPAGVLLRSKLFLLELSDAEVVLTSYGADGHPSSRTSSRGSLCDNKWHTIRATCSRSHVTLAVDDGPVLPGASDAVIVEDSDEGPSSPLYVGGLPEGLSDTQDSAKENFKGCIKDISINGHSNDWRSMESLHGVLLDSCPVQE